MVVFLDESCKMKNTHVIVAILRNYRKPGPFGEVCQGHTTTLSLTISSYHNRGQHQH